MQNNPTTLYNSQLDQACEIISALDYFGGKIANLGDPAKIFVDTEFVIDNKHFNILGMLDTGNTFLNCIDFETCKKLGFSQTDLIPSHKKAVKQAGKGSVIQILGLLPGKQNNGFKFKNLNKLFPIQDIYVLQGLEQDFNISLKFLYNNKFDISLSRSLLIYKENQREETHIPLISTSEAESVMCAVISPTVPLQGIKMAPHETIVVGANKNFKGSSFTPRQISFTSKDPTAFSSKTWQISELKQFDSEVPKYEIQNLSLVPKTIYRNFNLGSICQILKRPNHISHLPKEEQAHRIKTISTSTKIDPQFTTNYLQQLIDVIIDYSDVISWDGSPGETTLGETQIHTGQATPVFCPPRRMSPDVAAIVEKQLNKWLEQGIIVRACNKGSRWNARLIVVPKRKISGCPQEYRLCCDLRHLNKLCIIDAAPFSPLTMQETFHMLGGAKVFSILDLTQAFAAIPIRKDHQYKTAFIFQGQVFYYAKTCFGLASAPAALGKVLAKALANVPRTFCIWYMDDIIIYSKSPSAHLKHITIVLKSILKSGLKLRLDKCDWYRTSLTFLGHLITTEGYGVIESYTSAIRQWPMVKSKYDTQAFLGSTQYYASFVQDYAMLAKPLYAILKKQGKDKDIQKFEPEEAKLIWQAMQNLKKALTTTPILAFADFQPGASEFILDTDFSQLHYTIGAVLSQEQPPGSGKERVIAYAAKMLRPSQHSYSSYKGEMYAVIYFLEKFKYFLQLRHFCLRCDCESLKWLRSQHDHPTGMILKWIQTLARNNFSVVHRPRKEHSNADSLSRCPTTEVVSESDDEAALATIETSTKAKPNLLNCPYCNQIATNQQYLDFHIAETHSFRRKLAYSDWKKMRNSQEISLQAAYTANPMVTDEKAMPAMLVTPFTAKSNNDNSITYSNDQWAEFQRADPPLKLAMDVLDKKPIAEPLGKAAQSFIADGILEDGILKFVTYEYGEDNPRHLAVVPFALQIPVLMYFHQAFGCAGPLVTIAKAKEFVFFKGMHNVFQAMKLRCMPCQKRSKPPLVNKFQLISHTYVEPWFCVAIDHVGPFTPEIDGNNYLLTLKDLFSGWVEIFPVPSTKSSITIQKLSTEIFARYGVPQIILADNHSSFISTEFTEFCESLGIFIKHPTATNARANFVERIHSDLKKKINSKLRLEEENQPHRFTCQLCNKPFTSKAKLSSHLNTHDVTTISEAINSPAPEIIKQIKLEMGDKRHTDWVATLPQVLWAMRIAVSESRGASPFQIIFGKNPCTSLHLLYNTQINEAKFSKTPDYLMARSRRNEIAEAFVKKHLSAHILKHRKFYQQYVKTFEKGDLVYLFTPVLHKDISDKLDTPWTGPWEVLERLASTTYKVGPIPGKFTGYYKTMVIQVDRIKKYLEGEPTVTPPLNFKQVVKWLENKPKVPQFQHSEKEVENMATDDPEIPEIQTQPDLLSLPWKSTQEDTTPMYPPLPEGTDPASIPFQEPTTVAKKLKKKLAKRFSELPTPRVTRATTKATTARDSLVTGSIATVDNISNHDSGIATYFIDEITHDDTYHYDNFMYER